MKLSGLPTNTSVHVGDTGRHVGKRGGNAALISLTITWGTMWTGTSLTSSLGHFNIYNNNTKRAESSRWTDEFGPWTTPNWEPC